MNAVNSTASNYVGFVQKAVTRNTVHQVIDAKQSGLSVYEANIKKQTVDTYIKSTEKANDLYGSDPDNSADNGINSFDAQAVNEAR